MTKKNESNAHLDKSESLPHRVRLPGFTGEERGLGDATDELNYVKGDRK